MNNTVTSQALSQFSPLDSLSPANLNELARKSHPVRVKAGKRLFTAGDPMPIQWFLQEGIVELTDPDGEMRRIDARTQAAKAPLEDSNPARRTAIARSPILAYTIDRGLLDMMITWDQSGGFSVAELSDESIQAAEEDDEDWMTKLLQAEAFHRIPPANIQAIFMRMEAVEVAAGEKIVRQGESGDYFYIIREGRCEVTRTSRGRPDGIRLAELGPGDVFGEEALISDSPRNATITMITPGTVMRLSKQDFQELLNEPLQVWVAFDDAQARVRQGARWLDVRLPSEYEAGHIKGAINLPLFILRMKASRLQDIEYIVYCDSGSRSSAGAFLLTERGFKASVLKGGISSAPESALE